MSSELRTARPGNILTGSGRRVQFRADEGYWLHLLRECRELNWQRRQKVNAFTGKADWEAHGRAVRERFRQAFGPMPERTPLNPQLVGVLERDGYVVEKLLIESQPGFYVPVNLYLPTHGKFPAPAVLNPLGHWANSKAEAVVQGRAIGLARRGYVALVYDPPGQGERSQFWDPVANANPLTYSTSQHAAITNPCFLIGQTLINHMVWDGVRMLDYLETRPEVDMSRIGCTGASGGGTYTMFLNAFDDRIKAAVPVCSNSTYERMLSQGQIGEPCQDPIASYRDDLEMADVLMCAAPNPVLLIAAIYDFFPLIGAREVYLDLKAAYTALGIPERTDLVEVPSRHDYNKPMREAMYAWFNRWLEHDADAIEEPFEPEPPENLWCTPTGQLITSIGGETVLSLNRARTRAVAAPVPSPDTAAAADEVRSRVLAAVPEVLGYGHRPSYSAPQTLERTTENGLTIEQLFFESEPDLPIPILLYAPATGGPHPTLLFLHDRGKGEECGQDGLVPDLARAGYLVAAADLRGWGETAWWQRRTLEADDFGWLGNDSMLADACYLLGSWPVTQRVLDIARTLDVLVGRDDVDPARLGVIGRGGGAIVALHAATLDPRIAGVAAYEMVASYRTIVDADDYKLSASAFIPDVLLYYDLPDLAGALAPAPTLIANPVDAMGDIIASGAAEEIYASAGRIRALLDVPASLRVQSGLDRAALRDELVAWATRLG